MAMVVAMTTVDLYTRLSIYDEGKDSLDRQEKDLRKWASDQGYTVRKVWRDPGKSGYKKGVARVGYDQAVSAVTKGEVDILASWKLDRLSRHGAGQVGLVLDDVEAVGGRLYFLKDSLDSKVPGHRMVIVMMSEQARQESANTATRVLAKNQANVESGLPVVGKRRYGYLPASQGIRGNTLMHPEEGPQVTALFKDYLDGTSMGALAKRMGWTVVRVRSTLSNPSYAGWIVRGGETYPAHESVARLASQQEFDRVQAKLKLNFNSGGGVVKHLASGIAECSICHKKLNFSNEYRCIGNMSHPTIRKDILEKAIRDKTIATLLDPEFKVDLEPNAKSIQDINAERTQVEEDIQDLLSGLSNGLKMSQLLPHLKPLQERQAALQDQSEALLADSVQARVLHEIATGMVKAGKAWEAKPPGERTQKFLTSLVWEDLPLDQRRELISGLFTIVVSPGRGAKRVSIERKKRS